MEKLLIMSNFSFFHSVSYPVGELSAIAIKFEIVVCKLLSVWKSLKFVVWERINFPSEDRYIMSNVLFVICIFVKCCHLVLSPDGFCVLLRTTFYPFPNKPWFLHVCSTSLLKTLWEKKKLLVTSNFSFSYHVFYPFAELSAIFNQI